MSNMFSNAKFGDRFMTRNEGVAIYQRSITENEKTIHFLFTENIGFGVNDDGLMDIRLDDECLEFEFRRPELDIIKRIS